MIERRHFLGCTGLLLASQLQARHRGRAKSIIVIGAGIAGLSCARVLKRAGLEVIVLEARDRIGGRIHTHRASGIPLDLGATWIHGAKQNPITKLAVDAKAKVVESDDESLKLVNGKREILSQTMLDNLNKEYKRVRQSLRQARKQAKPKSSLGDVVPSLLETVPKELREAVRWQIFSEIELNYASDLETLSLAAWDMDEAFQGAELVFPEGYDSVPKYLSQGLDIRLKHVVSAVHVTEMGVKVNTERQSFTADRCVVTLPLGVLKAGAVKFSPALPATKRQAIQNLGAGRFCKIAAVFDKVFWPKVEHRFACITAPHFEVWSPWPTHHQPALFLLSSGAVAESWEHWKSDEVEREALRLLQRVFKPLPKPKHVIATRWGIDPYTRGAYSSVASEATMQDFDTLAAPVGNRLFFAGEATSREYPGTVHGAYLSGVREAERILALNK